MGNSNFRKVVLFLIIVMMPVGPLFAKPYKRNVVCSYYAEDFHGKKTSNGESFNMYSMTCAHKSLPFNTVLKITNRANGKSVEVRVNDRGPFVYAREVDLSKAAAVKLDMIKSGTAHCDIDIIKMGPNTKLSRDTAAKVDSIMRARGQTGPENNKSYEAGTFWDIQVGSFSSKDNATNLAKELLKKGFKDVVLQKTPSVYRVVVRKVPAVNVKSTEKRLRDFGYSNIVIRQRKK